MYAVGDVVTYKNREWKIIHIVIKSGDMKEDGTVLEAMFKLRDERSGGYMTLKGNPEELFE